MPSDSMDDKITVLASLGLLAELKERIAKNKASPGKKDTIQIDADTKSYKIIQNRLFRKFSQRGLDSISHSKFSPSTKKYYLELFETSLRSMLDPSINISQYGFDEQELRLLLQSTNLALSSISLVVQPAGFDSSGIDQVKYFLDEPPDNGTDIGLVQFSEVSLVHARVVEEYLEKKMASLKNEASSIRTDWDPKELPKNKKELYDRWSNLKSNAEKKEFIAQLKNAYREAPEASRKESYLQWAKAMEYYFLEKESSLDFLRECNPALREFKGAVEQNLSQAVSDIEKSYTNKKCNFSKFISEQKSFLNHFYERFQNKDISLKDKLEDIVKVKAVANQYRGLFLSSDSSKTVSAFCDLLDQSYAALVQQEKNKISLLEANKVDVDFKELIKDEEIINSELGYLKPVFLNFRGLSESRKNIEVFLRDVLSHDTQDPAVHRKKKEVLDLKAQVDGEIKQYEAKLKPYEDIAKAGPKTKFGELFLKDPEAKYLLADLEEAIANKDVRKVRQCIDPFMNQLEKVVDNNRSIYDLLHSKLFEALLDQDAFGNEEFRECLAIIKWSPGLPQSLKDRMIEKSVEYAAGGLQPDFDLYLRELKKLHQLRNLSDCLVQKFSQKKIEPNVFFERTLQILARFPPDRQLDFVVNQLSYFSVDQVRKLPNRCPGVAGQLESSILAMAVREAQRLRGAETSQSRGQHFEAVKHWCGFLSPDNAEKAKSLLISNLTLFFQEASPAFDKKLARVIRDWPELGFNDFCRDAEIKCNTKIAALKNEITKATQPVKSLCEELRLLASSMIPEELDEQAKILIKSMQADDVDFFSFVKETSSDNKKFLENLSLRPDLLLLKDAIELAQLLDREITLTEKGKNSNFGFYELFEKLDILAKVMNAEDIYDISQRLLPKFPVGGPYDQEISNIIARLNEVLFDKTQNKEARIDVSGRIYNQMGSPDTVIGQYMKDLSNLSSEDCSKLLEALGLGLNTGNSEKRLLQLLQLVSEVDKNFINEKREEINAVIEKVKPNLKKNIENLNFFFDIQSRVYTKPDNLLFPDFYIPKDGGLDFFSPTDKVSDLKKFNLERLSARDIKHLLGGERLSFEDFCDGLPGDLQPTDLAAVLDKMMPVLTIEQSGLLFGRLQTDHKSSLNYLPRLIPHLTGEPLTRDALRSDVFFQALELAHGSNQLSASDKKSLLLVLNREITAKNRDLFESFNDCVVPGCNIEFKSSGFERFVRLIGPELLPPKEISALMERLKYVNGFEEWKKDSFYQFQEDMKHPENDSNDLLRRASGFIPLIGLDNIQTSVDKLMPKLKGGYQESMKAFMVLKQKVDEECKRINSPSKLDMSLFFKVQVNRMAGGEGNDQDVSSLLKDLYENGILDEVLVAVDLKGLVNKEGFAPRLLSNLKKLLPFMAGKDVTEMVGVITNKMETIPYVAIKDLFDINQLLKVKDASDASEIPLSGPLPSVEEMGVENQIDLLAMLGLYVEGKSPLDNGSEVLKDLLRCPAVDKRAELALAVVNKRQEPLSDDDLRNFCQLKTKDQDLLPLLRINQKSSLLDIKARVDIVRGGLSDTDLTTLRKWVGEKKPWPITFWKRAERKMALALEKDLSVSSALASAVSTKPPHIAVVGQGNTAGIAQGLGLGSGVSSVSTTPKNRVEEGIGVDSGELRARLEGLAGTFKAANNSVGSTPEVGVTPSATPKSRL